LYCFDEILVYNVYGQGFKRQSPRLAYFIVCGQENVKGVYVVIQGWNEWIDGGTKLFACVLERKLCPLRKPTLWTCINQNDNWGGFFLDFLIHIEYQKNVCGIDVQNELHGV